MGERYRRFFENSQDMLYMCDRTGKILDLNPYGVNLLGLGGKGEAIGLNLFVSFFADSRRGEEVRRGLEEKGHVKDLEVLLRTGHGDSIMVLFSGTMTDRGGAGSCELEGAVKDITARKRMERQLLQAEKLASLEQLSAGLAHELNNPLGLVLGYTRLILKDADPGMSFYEDLKVVQRHALNCKKIVENLVGFSRARTTKKSLTDVNDLVGDVLGVVESELDLEKVQVVRKVTDNLPRAMLDPDKMGQVFMNILMNAQQAIEGTGAITVSTDWDREGGRICIAFSDTGSGIPPEIIHKIFDPFFTTKPTGMGTGLGLAVSYGIVQEHDGEIRAESTPGEGSTFIVELPAWEARNPKTDEGPEES